MDDPAVIQRRKLLTLAAPALISGREALAQAQLWPGFPTNYDPRTYPKFSPSRGVWNSQHPLARGLQFGIVLSPNMGLLSAWDFVNYIFWYTQNSGTSGSALGGVGLGSGIRFTSASTGYLQPSVSNPAGLIQARYITPMLGAISLVFVCNWPVGATSTGTIQTGMAINGGAAGYAVAYDFEMSDTMGLYRAGAGGSNYYVSIDTGTGAGSEYTNSRLTTLGVSQDGVFPSGSLKFYRHGKHTGSSSVTHDMSNPPTGGALTPTIGTTNNNVGSFNKYFNGIMSMIYGYNRVLSDQEFMAIQNDPWWPLQDPIQAVAGFHPPSAALGGSRGYIIQ